ncbi:MAG: hypothetical protein KDH19_10195 [Geminicoccaceae bacterium]|nr:hypothetical protein [Geminicoccaceae bacterium]
MSVEQTRPLSASRSLRLPIDWRFGIRAFLWLFSLTLLTLLMTTSRFF